LRVEGSGLKGPLFNGTAFQSHSFSMAQLFNAANLACVLGCALALRFCKKRKKEKKWEKRKKRGKTERQKGKKQTPKPCREGRGGGGSHSYSTILYREAKLGSTTSNHIPPHPTTSSHIKTHPTPKKKKTEEPCGFADELLLATVLSLDDMQHVHRMGAHLRQAHLHARALSLVQPTATTYYLYSWAAQEQLV
jgi:hypothetical protein